MGNIITTSRVELSNGENIFYREAGAGEKVLLFIHGNTNSSINWDILLEALPGDKFRMIAPDLRGFGESTYNKPVEKIKDFSEDIKLFADKMGLEKFVLIGWSAGGAVSEQFAADYPEMVEKLILLAASSIKGFPLEKRGFLGKVKKGQFIKTRQELAKAIGPMIKIVDSKNLAFLRRISDMSLYKYNKPSDEKYSAYIDEMAKQRNLLDIDYALMTFNISHENNGVVDGTGEVDNIKCPVLILQGERDVLVTEEMARYNKTAMGDKAELVIIKNSGHVPLVDNLEVLTESMLKFID